MNANESGDLHAAAELLPLVYDELRRLAAVQIACEKPGQTFDATALVHEAYLKLAGAGSFATKSQFFRAAAQAMRRILIDHARATAFRDWAYARAFLSAALGGEKNSQNP